MGKSSRQRISTGSPYEPIIGISRAVRSGRVIAVTGTAPLGTDGKTVAIGDPFRSGKAMIRNYTRRYRRVRRKNVRGDPQQDSFDTNGRLGKASLSAR